MPVRDVEEFVHAAVESAMRQTLGDIEIVVVDDHSTDSTVAKVMSLARSDSRVRVISSRGDRLQAARNTGIAASRGRYIAILDGDDVWEPENLTRQVDALETNPGVDLTFAASTWIDSAGRSLPRTIVRRDGIVSYEQLLIEFYPVNGSSMVVRRSAVEQAGGFDPDLKAGGDHEFALRVALLRESNILGLPDALIRYRRRRGQITANEGPRIRAWEQVLEKHRRLAPEVVARAEPRATARFRRALSAIAWESGDYRGARQLLTSAVRGAPLDLLRDRRTWLTGAAVFSSWLPATVRGRLQRRASPTGS